MENHRGGERSQKGRENYNAKTQMKKDVPRAGKKLDALQALARGKEKSAVSGKRR